MPPSRSILGQSPVRDPGYSLDELSRRRATSEPASSPAAPTNVVILKRDRCVGEMVGGVVSRLWPRANVQVFQRGEHALRSMESRPAELYVAGVKIADMDGLQHLEAHPEKTAILVMTSRSDPRTYLMLSQVRLDGVFDAAEESAGRLPFALRESAGRRGYISRSAALRWTRLRRGGASLRLSAREQIVLSVIGCGSDDREACVRLRVSAATIATQRKSIMRKLNLHHRGQLIMFAVQHGFVDVTPSGVCSVGFVRTIDEAHTPDLVRPGEECGALRFVHADR